MKVKVIEENKNKLVLQVKGEGHAFCNALKKELWNDKHVKIAAYKIEHPLVGVPTMIVETDGKETPKKALSEAAKRLSKVSDNFKTAFLKGIK
jgi:DNA-directed RNA polymerase subunit L